MALTTEAKPRMTGPLAALNIWVIPNVQRVAGALFLTCLLFLSFSACAPEAADSPEPAASLPSQSSTGFDIRRLDPPAADGAQAFSLRRLADGIGLVWLEPRSSEAEGAEETEEEQWSLRFSRFADQRWSTPVEIVGGSSFFVNWADTPDLVESEAAQPTLYVHWLEKVGEGTYAYGVFFARSEDGGRSWTKAGRLHDDDSESEHGFVSWSPAGAGVRAFWLDGRQTVDGGPMTLRTAFVDSAGAGPSELIDPAVCDCCSTSAVSVTANGESPEDIMVAYRDRSEDEVRDISVVTGVPGKWSAPQPAAEDGWRIHGCPVNGPSLAAGAEETSLAWFTAAADEPRILLSQNLPGEDVFGTPMEVDRGAWVLGRVGVVAPLRGGAVVSWLAGSAESGAVHLRRLLPNGVLGPDFEIVRISGARASGVPKLAVAGSEAETLFLAYRDPDAADGEGRLQVLAISLDQLDVLSTSASEGA